jgi:hypothetical protein
MKFVTVGDLIINFENVAYIKQRIFNGQYTISIFVYDHEPINFAFYNDKNLSDFLELVSKNTGVEIDHEKYLTIYRAEDKNSPIIYRRGWNV